MIANKKLLIIFTLIQILLAQTSMILMKAYSLGTGKDFISFFTSLSFYILIFVIPIIFYLRCINKVSPLSYLKLGNNVLSGIIKAILIGSFIFVVFLIRSKTHSLRNINFKADIFLIVGKVLVGPLEETIFRGFYLQKYKKYTGFTMANLISSTMFACLHIAIMWSNVDNLIFSLVYIMIIGLWMGYIFEKTKSLWCVSIIHSIYDLSIWLLL
jgi:membrane protease YdiL (CAAX protease family)